MTTVSGRRYMRIIGCAEKKTLSFSLNANCAKPTTNVIYVSRGQVQTKC